MPLHCSVLTHVFLQINGFKATTNQNKTQYPQFNEPTKQQRLKHKPPQKNTNKHYQI